jgi:hypothetical protein
MISSAALEDARANNGRERRQDGFRSSIFSIFVLPSKIRSTGIFAGPSAESFRRPVVFKP